MALVGSPGCLLGKTLVPDDVELVPLVPPAIIEIPDSTNAAPGTVTVFPPTGGPRTQTFAVSVIGGTTGDTLEGRYFVDRDFPCTARTPDSPDTTCGQFVPSPPPVVSRVDGVPVAATVSIQITRAYFTDLSGDPQHVCHHVDLFVSSRFLVEDVTRADAHVPARPGDVVHARWYVVNQADPAVGIETVRAESCLHPVAPN